MSRSEKMTVRALDARGEVGLLRRAFGWSGDAPLWTRDAALAWGLDFAEYLRRIEGGGVAFGLFLAGEAVGVVSLWPLVTQGGEPGPPGFFEAHFSARRRTPAAPLVRAVAQLYRRLFRVAPAVRAVVAWVCSRNASVLSLCRLVGLLPTGRTAEVGRSRGRALRWVELLVTRRDWLLDASDRGDLERASFRPAERQGWACAYVAALNLYALAGLSPPPLGDLLAWAASHLGRSKALAHEPRDEYELAAAGLTRYDLAALLEGFGFPLPLTHVSLDDGRAMRDVLPGLLRGGRMAVLWLRLRYRGRVYGHATAAFDSSPEGVECLDWLCAHRRVMPWSFGRREDLRESLHFLRRGRPAHGHVTRYGWDTIPAEATPVVNGSRVAQPLGIERQLLLAG